TTIAVDLGEPSAVVAALRAEKWRLDAIWNTHHHWDHVGGNLALKQEFDCEVFRPAGEEIPGRDRAVKEGDSLFIGNHRALVMETPGHTLGHVVYHLAEGPHLFCGDTLFVLGCGRLFEGSP